MENFCIKHINMIQDFKDAIETALDFEVDAKKVCQHLKANAKSFQINFNQ
jgi:hypothetical protein